MTGLFLSGCFTAADVLSAEIILRDAAAHPDKLCPAKATELSVIILQQRRVVLRAAPNAKY